MLAIAFFAPLRHGMIGTLDELELCVAPMVVAITIWVLRLLSARTHSKRDRQRRLRIKDSTNVGRKDR
jgi:hypothetical protein